MNSDDGLKKLGEIYDEFSTFCSKRGQVNEADTRAKVIDRILKEVLGWNEGQISRESAVSTGYLDYEIQNNKRLVLIVEAKKEGLPFEVPASLRRRRRYKLSGSIKSDKAIRETIEQVQKYCVEKACRYAVATNGYAWIVFRALREDLPWRLGDCIVFESAGEVKKCFTEFWNLLSLDAVVAGGLDKAFSNELLSSRALYRPTQFLQDPEASLTRNRYHSQLNPFIESIFRDIGDQGQADILRECYVYGKSLEVLDKDLDFVIKDSMPSFIEKDGGDETLPDSKRDPGLMGRQIARAVERPSGMVFLLLGGIGCGKTTYIKRFFYHAGKNFLEENCLSFYVGFLTPPQSPEEAEDYLFDQIQKEYRKKYAGLGLEERKNLFEIYAQEIRLLKETYPRTISDDDHEFNLRLSKKFEEWTKDTIDYTGRFLRSARKRNKTVIVCVDNVDQLSPEYQSKIFLVAQRVSKELSAIVVMALREESYYAASIRHTFTAYSNRKFHIASPPFRWLVSLRMKYCRHLLALPNDEGLISLGAGVSFNKEDISNFLDIIEHSIFSYNKNISRFIEALTFGNMREALDMFATFMYSGATNVDKMLKIFHRDGKYYVAFHEFAKSVMLGDRKYFKDSESRIINLFECGQDKNASHFTSLRLLFLLLSRHHVGSPEGRGFVLLNDVFDSFLDVFDNEIDLRKTILRLVNKELVQLDTRSTSTLNGASHIRISSSGWYYSKYLVRAFAYLDLVFQDTPLSHEGLAKDFKRKIIETDRLPETQEFVPQKMGLRFERVQAFLDYLQGEEDAEWSKYSLERSTEIFGRKIVDQIREQFEKERDWILDRLKRNSESHPDDLILDDGSQVVIEDGSQIMSEEDVVKIQTELDLPSPGQSK